MRSYHPRNEAPTGTRCAVRSATKKNRLGDGFLAYLLIVFSCFRDVGLVTCFGDSLHERVGASGGRCLTRKDVAEHHVMAIDGASRVVVLLDYRTFKCQAGKYAFRARVG